MKNHVIENGHCTIYHTRSYEKKPGKGSKEHMLTSDYVHVFSILIHMDGRRRKNDRVLVHVRLWARHTPHFEIEKIEKVSPVEMERDVLVLSAGKYLWFFQEAVYRYFVRPRK